MKFSDLRIDAVEIESQNVNSDGSVKTVYISGDIVTVYPGKKIIADISDGRYIFDYNSGNLISSPYDNLTNTGSGSVRESNTGLLLMGAAALMLLND